jgi:hypothetical protein
MAILLQNNRVPTQRQYTVNARPWTSLAMDDLSFQVSPPNDALEPSYIVADSVSIPHPGGIKGQMPCGNQGPHHRVGPNMPIIAHLKIPR